MCDQYEGCDDYIQGISCEGVNCQLPEYVDSTGCSGGHMNCTSTGGCFMVYDCCAYGRYYLVSDSIREEGNFKYAVYCKHFQQGGNPSTCNCEPPFSCVADNTCGCPGEGDPYICGTDEASYYDLSECNCKCRIKHLADIWGDDMTVPCELNLMYDNTDNSSGVWDKPACLYHDIPQGGCPDCSWLGIGVTYASNYAHRLLSSDAWADELECPDPATICRNCEFIDIVTTPISYKGLHPDEQYFLYWNEIHAYCNEFWRDYMLVFIPTQCSTCPGVNIDTSPFSSIWDNIKSKFPFSTLTWGADILTQFENLGSADLVINIPVYGDIAIPGIDLFYLRTMFLILLVVSLARIVIRKIL